MPRIDRLKTILIGTAAASAIATTAYGASFNIPAGSLEAALNAYTSQSGVAVIAATDQVRNARTKGVVGDLSPDAALTRILKGTGFVPSRDKSGAINILRNKQQSSEIEGAPMLLAQAAPARTAVETVTVTSSKLGGADVQSIPISITALSQEQLTATQTAGGPDLIKQVPNMTFTKTNFAGYSIQLRGIGTQAISVTTDPAVAVAFNDIPFIRNHFFEQEFFDTAQVEVLRGPQGTLYGRNATAGVVNINTAKPTDQFEAMASGELGNYHQRRFEGMVNLPIVDDRLDIRIAGEWTKRQGYSFNEQTDDRIDGRDLWSGRVSIGLKPVENLQMNLVWEHFSEDDDRIRSAKQLCKTDYGPGGSSTNTDVTVGGKVFNQQDGAFYIMGCKPASLYSPESFQTPNGASLPYVLGLIFTNAGVYMNPYASAAQSSNLRVINSGIDPIYKAKNDVIELNSDYVVTPSLTITSQTGFSHDFLYSAEDYNRFGSAPGLIKYNGDGANPAYNGVLPDPSGLHVCVQQGGVCDGVTLGTPCANSSPFDPNASCQIAGYVCDPQLGCSDSLILEDLSEEHSWQFSQELRMASNFSGPFNFTAGGNYLHYETEENYYVFGNVLTLIDGGYVPSLGTNSNSTVPLPVGYRFNGPGQPVRIGQGYIDPNPISNLDGNGHNYFLSKNPYVLNSYAAFGEANYNVLSDLKLTAGLRWTEDQKHFSDIPSWLVTSGWGYPVFGVVDQQWDQFTGRAVANWTPKLEFTDQTLIFGSYAHGYKAGGANPPGAIFSSVDFTHPSVQPTHPLTFRPEFIDAFELGTKNTLLDGALTLNGSLFYYNYENYQISEIVDRTAINHNYDAHAKGAELEATWEPTLGLRFNFSGGWENTAIAKGQSAVDLMDRTAGTPGWVVVKPFVNEASNCIFPEDVAKYLAAGTPAEAAFAVSYCAYAYILHLDPVTLLPYVPNPTTYQPYGGAQLPAGYQGFDPSTAPNNGTGFSKDIGGNSLPNAPPFTLSFGAQYSVPISPDWAGTLRTDLYWQDASWWRVFNDLSYDQLRGYHTVNLTLILTSQSGWQVMLYDKNIFNTTAITGGFLNSDDSGLTTNVFLTDPKLVGIRVTKNW